MQKEENMSVKYPGGILSGIKVLDITRMLSGPYCSMLLADNGADVIKIESAEGDTSRRSGPYRKDDKKKQWAGYFVSLNRNKKSVVLNLKDNNDKTKFIELVKTADVLIENFRPGVMERLNLGYERLLEINPKLVYGAIRGFGDSRSGGSPYLDWPSYDVVAQAMGGPIGLTGENAKTPMKIGPGIGDIFSGVMLSFGLLAALRHSEKTGQGQFVDLAMFDAMISLCERAIYQYDYTKEIPKPSGNFHPFIAPFGIFPTKDGNVALAVVENHFWIELVTRLKKNDYANKKEFNSVLARRENIDLVNKTVSTWTLNFSNDELSALLGGYVPFGPVNNIKDVLEDKHLDHRRVVETISNPDSLTPWKVAGNPLNFSLFSKEDFARPPILGEHNKKYIENNDLIPILNKKELRKAFANFATGVTIVTTRQNDHVPRGFTANSFSSVSLEPPILLVCLSKNAKSIDTFLGSEYFCVSILAENQKDIASSFATQREDKFDLCEWSYDKNNMPLIDKSLAYFSCSTKTSIDAGDHIILLGNIEDFSASGGSPLCYFRSDYISLTHEKSLADIASQTGLTSLGGILVNQENCILLIRNDGSYTLPRAEHPENGSDGFIQYLKSIGIQCSIEGLYSVYYDKSRHQYAIFYRGEGSLSNSKSPVIPIEFIPLSDIGGLSFLDEAEEIMIKRYVKEQKNNSFGLYEGDQKQGHVRNFKD